jgi:hypothetical protein
VVENGKSEVEVYPARVQLALITNRLAGIESSFDAIVEGMREFNEMYRKVHGLEEE